jgi:type 1 fimbriae regulatory protein FimB
LRAEATGYQRMVARAGKTVRFPFLIHSHMLRHSTGYKLANDGQDTLLARADQVIE